MDLRLVKGTGKDGRILKEDILSHMESSPPPKVADVVASMGGAGGGALRRPSKVLATPAVRRIASEEGVNLSDIQGTGEEGRIMKEDLQHHIDALRGMLELTIMLVRKVLYSVHHYFLLCACSCTSCLSDWWCGTKPGHD